MKYSHSNIILIFSLWILVMLLSSFNCANNKNRNEKNESVLLVVKLPIIKLNGQLTYINDSIYVSVYKGKYYLYQFPNRFSIEDDSTIKFRELRHCFFIFRKNDSHGVFFHSVQDTNGTSMSIDSLLNRKTFATISINEIVNESNLVDSIKEIHSGNVIKKYSSKKVIDESYNDSLYLVFTKKKEGVSFPFSREIDSLTNLRLINVRILFNEKYSKTYKINLPKREMSFQVVDTGYMHPNVEPKFALFKRRNAISD